MSKKDYPIVLIFSDDEQAWIARVEQLPGLMVDGATPEEALRNAKEAIVNWVETAKELGRPVPAPLSDEELAGIQQAAIQQQTEMLQMAFQHAVAAATSGSQQFTLGAGGAVDITKASVIGLSGTSRVVGRSFAHK